MDKFNLGAFTDILKGVKVKTASALREILSAKDSETAGTLNARERLEKLFDIGTFSEIGAYVRRRSSELETDPEYDFESVICGWGAVNGRLVYAYSQDISRTSGSVSEAHAKKICELYRLATQNGAPVVGIFDSAGALITEGVKALAGYGNIMKAVSSASGVIPQIALVTGNVSGAAAVICGMYDIVIKCEDAALSVNPKFNINAGDAADSGITALKVPDVAAAVESAKLILNYLPSNNAEGTPEGISNDNVNRTVSIAVGDAYAIISSVVDDGRFVELYSDYAHEMVGGLASIGGVAVGIIATNKSVNCGVLSAPAARKASRLVSLYDSFNIPVITFVDSCGLDKNVDSESSPYAAELAKLASAYAASTAPVITVITGEAYGSAFTVLGSKALGADVVLALDSAKIAAMNASSAVAFLMNDQITAEVSRADLEKAWDESVATPVAAAASGEIDDIIDSSELRQRIAASVNMLSSKSMCSASRKHLTMPL